MQKVLQHLRVVEIGGLGPGPFCAMHLADLGADVISLVRPSTGNAPAITSDLLNRGKRSVFADLKTEAGRALVLQLIAQADVLIEGMRPGSMERLGLGPRDCHAINPALVYGRMTGWGQSGPLAHSAGHDTNYVAVAGALWGSSPADARPVSPFAVLGDIGGGALYLMTGLLAGVIQARHSGQGCVVDAAIVDGAAHMLNLMLSTQATGLLGTQRGASIHDSSPFYDSYVCADGQHITIGAIEPQFYQLLLERLGLAQDPDFQGQQWQRSHWPRRRARLAALFLSQPQAHWQSLLEGSDACFGAVLSPWQAAEHPHLQARGVYSYNAQNQLQASPAPRFGDAPYPSAPSSANGADTEAVMERLARGEGVWR